MPCRARSRIPWMDLRVQTCAIGRPLRGRCTATMRVFDGLTPGRHGMCHRSPRLQDGTPLQELMDLGSWASYEMVLRYAHLAADHLQGAACRIDATFLLQTKNPHQVRAA